MNHDEVRRRTSVLSGGTLSVRVPEDVADVDNSFKSITTGSNHDGRAIVSLSKGMTRLRIRGVEATFDGYRYFPRVPDDHDHDAYRGDVGDAKIDFEEDFVDFAATHPLRNLTVEALIDGLTHGWIEPLPKK